MSIDNNNQGLSEDNNDNLDQESELPRQNSNQDVAEEIDYKKKAEELEERLVRSLAEIENTRNRFSKQLQDNTRYAISGFVKQLVTVFENFFRVIDNAPKDAISENEAFNAFFEGVNLTHKDLVSTLESSGIKRIYPLNEQFDHNLHQVINHVDSDKEPGTIVDVVQAGYSLNGRILKEALVVIAK